MNIWVVEDQYDDALKGCETVADLARERFGDGYAESVKIYRDKTIEWPPKLHLFGEKEAQSPTDCAEAKPAIVVLDLFVGDDEFKAGDFFQALRKWERNFQEDAPRQSTRRRSFVILWTVWSSREEVIAFLNQTRERDRRVNYTNTKGWVSLRLQLEGFWRQWDEEKYP
jgi:hypothetical protein